MGKSKNKKKNKATELLGSNLEEDELLFPHVDADFFNWDGSNGVNLGTCSKIDLVVEDKYMKAKKNKYKGEKNIVENIVANINDDGGFISEKEKIGLDSNVIINDDVTLNNKDDNATTMVVETLEKATGMVDDFNDPKIQAQVSWAELFKKNRTESSGIKLRKIISKVPKKAIFEVQDLDNVEEKWGYCLVGFFAGRFPGIFAINEIRKNWTSPSKFYAHDSGWIIFRFNSEGERENVLNGGPYVIYGKQLLLKNMPSDFDFSLEAVVVQPLWVTLPGLPLFLWNELALSKIASLVGNPLFTDGMTATRGKPGYARVLIEVDISKDIIYEVELGMPDGKTKTQKICYEHIPKLCKLCRSFGHDENLCNLKEVKNLGGVSDGVHVNQERGRSKSRHRRYVSKPKVSKQNDQVWTTVTRKKGGGKNGMNKLIDEARSSKVHCEWKKMDGNENLNVSGAYGKKGNGIDNMSKKEGKRPQYSDLFLGKSGGNGVGSSVVQQPAKQVTSAAVQGEQPHLSTAPAVNQSKQQPQSSVMQQHAKLDPKPGVTMKQPHRICPTPLTPGTSHGSAEMNAPQSSVVHLSAKQKKFAEYKAKMKIQGENSPEMSVPNEQPHGNAASKPPRQTLAVTSKGVVQGSEMPQIGALPSTKAKAVKSKTVVQSLEKFPIGTSSVKRRSRTNSEVMRAMAKEMGLEKFDGCCDLDADSDDEYVPMSALDSDSDSGSSAIDAELSEPDLSD